MCEVSVQNFDMVTWLGYWYSFEDAKGFGPSGKVF